MYQHELIVLIILFKKRIAETIQNPHLLSYRSKFFEYIKQIYLKQPRNCPKYWTSGTKQIFLNFTVSMAAKQLIGQV